MVRVLAVPPGLYFFRPADRKSREAIRLNWSHPDTKAPGSPREEKGRTHGEIKICLKTCTMSNLLLVKGGKSMCRGSESNRRHADFQSAALPPELPRHKRNYILKTHENQLPEDF